MSVYRPECTLHDILLDGWSRGFQIEQTVQEARDHGCPVTEEEVRQQWNEYQIQCDQWFAQQEASYAQV